jgi:glyoxylase-like metal-dependent hydrolase (beta-lactamase superfamily II)
MEQFLGAQVVASNYDKDFVLSDLPNRSLCSYLGVRTPNYSITQWAPDHTHLHFGTVYLRLQTLHTPGHTPDSLAIWDDEDKVLFVGDTAYEWTPTQFPAEGDIVDWLGSVDKLMSFVQEKVERMPYDQPVYLNCGHVTSGGNALEVLSQIRDFMLAILGRLVPVDSEVMKRGERHVVYGSQGVDRFVISCPERLVREAREKLDL